MLSTTVKAQSDDSTDAGGGTSENLRANGRNTWGAAKRRIKTSAQNASQKHVFMRSVQSASSPQILLKPFKDTVFWQTLTFLEMEFQGE